MPRARKPRKKMGRPPKPGGAGVLVAARLPPALAAAMDLYADRVEITRSQAVRRLIEAGLRAKLRGR
ncbi:hypothetical protein [Reyranella sp.]|uniref:hypothetical protein n=1 Tax=Reyranella sp. TaxID=1929291 RepID=UPI003F726A19